MDKSTWLATPNIAVVKYWGKRDNFLNLPDNGPKAGRHQNQGKSVVEQ
ncbi:MAG: hypothetical protein NTV88_01020 [Candidatus Micrarchaeota archaeon]|nr:hypothetical protein [Candidatus Micrarchaeota archaeon]